MENEFDYYLIGNSFKGGRVPLLEVDDSVDPSGTDFLDFYNKVPADYAAHLCFGPPVPSNPSLDVDGLALGDKCCVFSEKIYNAVYPHHFKGLQFVPAVIRGMKDEKISGFYIANIYRILPSFDQEQSIYKRVNKLTGKWDGIKKIVLDKERLSKIPVEDRLVFVAEEKPAFVLYHKTIVDAIMSTNPEGITVTPVEEWHEGGRFNP